MKKTLLLALTGAITLTAPATVAAQNGPEEEEITTVIVGDKGAVEEVISELQYNAPQRIRESGLPRFAIVGHDRKFYLGIGAQLNGVAAFDWGDNMPSTIDFIPASMTPAAPGNGGKLGFSAATSNFYLNVVALPGNENSVGLFFKGKFNNGGNYGFKLSHFYVKYRGLTAGYTNSLFQDNSAIPYTIDNQGPNGSAAVSIMTGSWTQNFGKGFSGAIGIEAPSADMADNRPGYTRQVTQRLPAIPLYVQYGWTSGSHVRLSAIARPLQYRDLTKGKNKTPLGWGVQLSGSVKICDPVTFYYDATYGYGIANYLQDDEGMNLDAMASYTDDGKMKLTESMGLTGGFCFQIARKWQSNLMYSHLSNWAGDGVRPAGDAYRYGDYVAANLLYDLNRFLTFGLEYNYGHAKDFAGRGLHANRLQGLLQITF